MKKTSAILLAFLLSITIGYSQTAEDLFKVGPLRYMGIDYSHVKLIGDFSQFMGTGETTLASIRNTYFPAWNTLFIEEPEKYDLKSMLRKDDIRFDLDMVTALNAKTPFETMEASKTPVYTKDDIQKFIRNYSTKQSEGIAVLFVAESMNKTLNEAYFHFVLIRLSDNEILIHERLRGEPIGMGIRNYWAGALFRVMENIQKNYYPKWKAMYVKQN
ncbi:MAG TPA: hypothetical protein VNW06_11365 [Cytophagaceae bacterium]|jgi:hypothetical protein|nr:hypothetical protein [Cytophagaceae bacterium]